jgi:hypothetical protein
MPVFVTSAGIRPFVRGIAERVCAQTHVLLRSEIHPRATEDGGEYLGCQVTSGQPTACADTKKMSAIAEKADVRRTCMAH